jgi:hypothetical protein
MKKPQTIGKTDQWPADQIVKRQVADLTPYARNSRQHSQAQIAQIAASIKEWGWTQPIIIDDEGGILAGHGRLLAAQHLGLEEVPCVVATGWSEAKRRAYVIADNRLAETATWDQAMLATELQDLAALDYDLALVGWDGEELAALLDGDPLDDADTGEGEDTEPQLDRAEELRQQWGVEYGQLWLLGEHRLLCGDSTQAGDVARLMGGEKANLCLTDPPYGIGDTSSDKNNYDEYDDSKENLKKTIAGFLPVAQRIAQVMVLTPGNGNTRLYPDPIWTMAWFTPAGVGRGPWGFCCWQPILCYGKDPKLSKGKGCHPDAIVHTESAEKLGHPCSKPIGFWEWLMNRTSEIGEVIYEPFNGSGTTLIACHNLNRRCRAIEISPAYVAVTLQRFIDHTGIMPTLAE